MRLKYGTITLSLRERYRNVNMYNYVSYEFVRINYHFDCPRLVIKLEDSNLDEKLFIYKKCKFYRLTLFIQK